MRVSLNAKGMLRHHFHGFYAATVGLFFETEGQTEMALAILGEGWVRAEKTPNFVLGTFSGDAYDAVEAQLVSFGADLSKMTSLAHNPDHGEPFSVTVTGEYTPPEQGTLF